MIIFIISLLTILTFLNIIVPYSGSGVVTPLLALLVPDPQQAIGIAAFYFLMSAIIRFFLFKKDIDWNEVKKLAPPSIIFAIFGGILLVNIPAIYVLIIIFGFMIFFLFKKIKANVDKKKIKARESRVGVFSVAAISGFFQGAGVGGGSDVRNGYLYAKGFDIARVHGTTTVIGGMNFIIAVTIRLLNGSLTIPNLLPLLFVLPFMIVATWLGRKALLKISKKATNIIIIIVMSIITIFLGLDIVNEILQ